MTASSPARAINASACATRTSRWRAKLRAVELAVVVTHDDPVNYTQPLLVTYRFHRLDSQIQEWGCTLEGANYDDRLNERAPKDDPEQ